MAYLHTHVPDIGTCPSHFLVIMKDSLEAIDDAGCIGSQVVSLHLLPLGDTPTWVPHSTCSPAHLHNDVNV